MDALALWRALRLIWAADPPRAAACLLIATAQAAVPVATAWLAKLVLDRASAALTVGGDTAAADGAFAAAAWLVAVQFAGRFLQPVQHQLGGNLLVDATALAERRVMAVGGAIPDLDHFERKEFHDEIALLQREIAWRPKALLANLLDLVTTTLTLAGALALLWRLQPLLPLALLACGIPQVAAQQRLQARAFQSIVARSGAAREMAYCAAVATAPGAAKEVLVYGVGPWFLDRWERLARVALDEMAGLHRAGLRVALASVAGNGVALALGFAYVATGVGSGRLTVGDLALYLGVVGGLQQTLYGLAFGAGSIGGGARFMARFFAFLDETRPSIALAPPGSGLPAPPRFRWGLELRRIDFAYPGRSEPVLRGVGFSLRAGETVAVVGANGAGKTTLVKLLTRLYDPTGGEILLDGVPLADYDLASLRGRIAVLSQDFARFSLTAGQNIGVGDAPFADDRERVLAAAARTGADEVLAGLPQGPDTPLTRAFAGGVDLSGGEWQKVAMARAAMRDAALVILDEPTAALDAGAEHELFRRFRELAAGRTVLLISHRFSTMRMADRILVLEGGRIVEAGSHDELVARGGRYAALYELQAGRYQ